MEKKLNPKWEKFCNLYATKKDFFGNGTQCYIEVYSTPKNPITYKTARTRAWQLLTNADILARINKLMEDMVLNDTFVDKQLGLLIEQDADFTSKLGAIKEYNSLKQRITKKIEIVDTNKLLDDINGTSNPPKQKEIKR